MIISINRDGVCMGDDARVYPGFCVNLPSDVK